MTELFRESLRFIPASLQQFLTSPLDRDNSMKPDQLFLEISGHAFIAILSFLLCNLTIFQTQCEQHKFQEVTLIIVVVELMHLWFQPLSKQLLYCSFDIGCYQSFCLLVECLEQVFLSIPQLSDHFGLFFPQHLLLASEHA